MNTTTATTATTAPADRPWEPEDMDHLVTAVLDGDLDMALVASLRPMLATAAWEELCGALEWCPVHATDYRICEDDGLECQCPTAADASGHDGGVL